VVIFEFKRFCENLNPILPGGAGGGAHCARADFNELQLLNG